MWPLITTALACASTRVRAPEPVRCDGLCSDGGGYAPVAQLFVTPLRSGDSLTVRVDSGTVGTPTLRRGTSTGPTLMAALTFRAFVAESDVATGMAGAPDSGASPKEHGWRLIAQGEAQPLAAELSFGEARPVPPSEFHLVLPQGVNASKAWLGFEIAGDAIDPRVESRARGTMRGGVRVYVCDPRSLAGRLDSVRAQRMRAAYGAAC
jgi:hypothetical protein